MRGGAGQQQRVLNRGGKGCCAQCRATQPPSHPTTDAHRSWAWHPLPSCPPPGPSCVARPLPLTLPPLPSLAVTHKGVLRYLIYDYVAVGGNVIGQQPWKVRRACMHARTHAHAGAWPQGACRGACEVVLVARVVLTWYGGGQVASHCTVHGMAGRVGVSSGLTCRGIGKAQAVNGAWDQWLGIAHCQPRPLSPRPHPPAPAHLTPPHPSLPNPQPFPMPAPHLHSHPRPGPCPRPRPRSHPPPRPAPCLPAPPGPLQGH